MSVSDCPTSRLVFFNEKNPLSSNLYKWYEWIYMDEIEDTKNGSPTCEFLIKRQDLDGRGRIFVGHVLCKAYYIPYIKYIHNTIVCVYG